MVTVELAHQQAVARMPIAGAAAERAGQREGGEHDQQPVLGQGPHGQQPRRGDQEQDHVPVPLRRRRAREQEARGARRHARAFEDQPGGQQHRADDDQRGAEEADLRRAELADQSPRQREAEADDRHLHAGGAHRQQAGNDGEGTDGGHHVDGERTGIGGRGPADLDALLGRDRPVGLELGDIDQELHGATPTLMTAAYKASSVPGFAVATWRAKARGRNLPCQCRAHVLRLDRYRCGKTQTLVGWCCHPRACLPSHLLRGSRGSILPQAPELAERWMVGTLVKQARP